MGRTFPNPGFYGILTDPVIGYEKLASLMVRHGVQVIQLRMKGTPTAEVLAMARSLREIVPPEVAFIVNDAPDIARDVHADGVHLGQDDMPFHQAREIVGPDMIIGLSTHSPAQTSAACALGPDYIGVGPVFTTPTKKKPDPVIGINGMRAMLKLATVPAIAIGGIDLANIGEVLGVGARNVCAVRCINRAPDPARELDQMLQAIEASRAR